MKSIHRIFANILFFVHCILFGVVLVGYLFPRLWYLYMACLSLALLSDVIFGYCLLTKWEFLLRKKWNPDTNYNYNFASYYTYKLTNGRVRDDFYRWAAVIFLGLSILLSLYFRFWY